MLRGGELVGIEQRAFATAIGAHGPPRDPHGDHDRHRENDDQHGDGEPTAGQLGTLLGDSVEQILKPVGEAFGQ